MQKTRTIRAEKQASRQAGRQIVGRCLPWSCGCGKPGQSQAGQETAGTTTRGGKQRGQSERVIRDEDGDWEGTSQHRGCGFHSPEPPVTPSLPAWWQLRRMSQHGGPEQIRPM